MLKKIVLVFCAIALVLNIVAASISILAQLTGFSIFVKVLQKAQDEADRDEGNIVEGSTS